MKKNKPSYLKKADVVVLGGGPAGLAAALAAYEDGASVIVLERDINLGGILNQCIHSGFGLHYFNEELSGPEYAARFSDKVREIILYEKECASENKCDPRMTVELNTMVLEMSADRIITAVSAEHGLIQIEAGSVVLAMGCRERSRGALNIPGTRPAGIFTAGCAQRLVNLEGKLPGKKVVILGSGDIGLIMARRFTYEGARVECVAEIMPYSSGLSRNIVQCLNDYDIPLYFNTTVVRIEGTDRVTAVTLAEVDASRKPIPGTEKRIECDTLLLSVGLIPENELSVNAGVEMDRITSGAVVNQFRETSIAGVFACGNVLHVHDLVDNVTKESNIAGHAAAAYVKGGYKGGREYSAIPKDAVRYILPQKLTAQNEGEVALYFRVKEPVKNPVCVIECGGRVIKKFRKLIMLPGEMETAVIKAPEISGDITVSVSEAVISTVKTDAEAHLQKEAGNE